MNSGPNVLGRPLSRLLIASTIAATLPAYANDATEIEKLKAQIEALDQQIRILGRKQEIVNDDVAAKQKAAPTVTASDKGFGIKSTDGQFEYRLRGLVQFDYRNFDGAAPAGTIYDGFLARRIRPTFEGTVFGKYGFRFTPEFAESGDGSNTTGIAQNKTRVIDAYLDARFDPAYSFRFGKFKPFVGLERLQSGSDIKFIERSYVSNNILPNRDFGLSLYGEALDKKLNYAVGYFNGVRDGGENFTTQDDNNQKDFAARVFSTPFAGTDSALAGLGVGIAGTWSDADSKSNALPSYKTAGQAYNFFAYSGARSNGRRERISPQAYYYYGPLGIIAEYAAVTQGISKTSGNASTNVTNSAWQIATSYLLTGEDASFKGVKPYQPFKSGAEGGWGAFELLARYQENNIDRDAVTFANTTNGYALGAKTWGVGVNWYLNEASRFSFNLERTKFSDVKKGAVLLGDTEDFAVARYQLAF
jgi:phosphate-selective porin OprO and OprP